MKTVVPDYYKEFSCIADECRHNCCIGWEIDIDSDTMRFYESLEAPLGDVIRSSIEHGEVPHFRLTDGEKCPHLDEDGLCRIISQSGEGAICEICREHPRFRNRLSGRTELGLGLCCEEACRIILSRTEPMKLVQDDIGEESPSEAEAAFFERRSRSFDIINDSALSIDDRLNKLVALWDTTLPSRDTSYWCDFLLSLERLDDSWGDVLMRLKCSCIRSLDACDAALPLRSAEALLEYFLYRYLTPCVEDGSFAEAIRFAVVSFYIIRAVCIVESQAENISFSTLCETARLFSSEIEYSVDNLDEFFFELSF